ncbi:trypsin-10-like [Cimex lectularius]|uniref:Peptidase S1 domain-containing protein n=1 Tax=Cimex lectularius TaxID=79782 RepID=A0A8I6SAU2_CIMLE|nr:trypsin-10-like [Cimex lectularius]XP_014260606.1 trypsin-10-like [Cimex lectularius]XP_014260608.1 trypsin-10-like [Cimex lectularius]
MMRALLFRTLLVLLSVSVNSERKLQGARYARYREFLYIVSIQDKLTKIHRCAGVLVTLKHVMTAGQCIVNFDEKVGISLRDHRNSIVYGVSRFTKEIETGVYRYVLSWHAHPKLSFVQDSYWSNDVGIVALSSGLSDDVASPVNIEIAETTTTEAYTQSNSTEDYITHATTVATTLAAPQSCKVIGWGWDRYNWHMEKDDNTEYIFQLKVVEVKLLNRDECEIKIRGIKPLFTFFNLSILEASCAEPMYTLNNTCFGEPGAPIICDDFLVGLSSWFVGCGSHPGPLVYSGKLPILDFYINYGFDVQFNSVLPTPTCTMLFPLLALIVIFWLK